MSLLFEFCLKLKANRVEFHFVELAHEFHEVKLFLQKSILLDSYKNSEFFTCHILQIKSRKNKKQAAP